MMGSFYLKSDLNISLLNSFKDFFKTNINILISSGHPAKLAAKDHDLSFNLITIFVADRKITTT
jgi:hypothetical protein